MCVTCGCSEGAETTLTNLALDVVEPIASSHTHILPDGTIITHDHDHHNPHSNHDHHPSHHHPSHHHSSHPASDHPFLPTASQPHRTTLTLEQNLLAKNDLIAAQNRGWFRGRNIFALNLVSSPGSGKTTLLTRTIQDLQDRIIISVLEGDQATTLDAQRIRETGCNVVQVNTGTGCHLEAAMVERGVVELNPPLNSIVMIENVGNLVCPALFDLGETAKVVILSVTEGEDKPMKYPHMFRASQVMILSKIDLLPYVSFEVDRCLDYARQVNPDLEIFLLSATTGEGLSAWYDWLIYPFAHPASLD